MIGFLRALLASLIFSINVSAQKNEVYIDTNSSSCSKTITLEDNGTYSYTIRCQEHSNTSFGTWVQVKDTIRFIQIDTKEFKIIRIDPSTTGNTNTVCVKIFDQSGQNITSKIRVKQYVPRKGTYELKLNIPGTEWTDFRRDSGIIIVEPFDKLSSGTLGVKIDSFTNFEITVNVPSNVVYNIGSDWMDTGNFDLLKRNDELVSVTTYPSDGNRKPFRLKYKRYRK